MKKILAVISAVSVVAGANAAINFNFDTPDMSVALPNSGSVLVTFTGTVDVTSGWDAQFMTVNFPHLANSLTTLSFAGFDSGFATYLNDAGAGVDYSGDLFSFTVSSTDAVGLYSYLANSTDIALTAVGGSNGVSQFSDTEAFSIEVTPVPEPATMAVLGLGAAALIRRRRK